MKILVVELEPTHYKADLWNAFTDSGKVDATVVFTERRNWSPDAGHDYQRFPIDRYESVVLEGKGLMGAIRSALRVLGMFRRVVPDLTYIAGYVHLQTVFAIIYASLLGKRFVVHADIFNNGRPEGRFSLPKWLLREALRRLVFARSEAVLVCGQLGVETARAAGCPEEKIHDFPYSISLARIRKDQPDMIPEQCAGDLRAGKSIVLFSGRMIPRKGLSTLLEAMAKLKTGIDWVLWIEGAGPELQEYVSLAQENGLSERCRFLGFCQYDLHSWLMRSADIVVVPSFEDSWGIVVDEGLQLGKAVVSSNATGSGHDRIEHGVNGYIFSAGDSNTLATTITSLLNDPNHRIHIGQAAANSSRNVRPEDNVITLMNVADRIR
ncbi:MAG: glycosyltransferase family 4 protein [Sedimenticola thiotaurini]|uniref:Glycosyltransferase family 4 protein n=1 Tax=Sedimenticola thiotaurini TaxID=1543721 RepID=A0A558DAM1_9GAMM|nr:MAG: glycosyltransferase family 4 protein [Sedimenticola thiotaurini]